MQKVAFPQFEILQKMDFPSFPLKLQIVLEARNPNPKYENGFQHLWHLVLGNICKTNDENL